MTSKEKRLIADCRIMVIGVSDFIDCVKAELIKSGFMSISIISALEEQPDMSFTDMVAEYVGAGRSCIKEEVKIPVIYPFDFVNGAGAIVIMPGDDNDLQHKDNLRLWAAEYMAGYCTFWNVEGCDWLQGALPAIREAKTSEAAQRTATHICARIAANIAVGRNVKHFPRFYLSKNCRQHRCRAQCQAFSEILSLQEFKVVCYWSLTLSLRRYCAHQVSQIYAADIF